MHRSQRGGSSIEFAFIVLTLVPLLLGTGATGVNMIRTLQTAQLARDAGHMFARGVDFSLTRKQDHSGLPRLRSGAERHRGHRQRGGRALFGQIRR